MGRQVCVGVWENMSARWHRRSGGVGLQGGLGRLGPSGLGAVVFSLARARIRFFVCVCQGGGSTPFSSNSVVSWMRPCAKRCASPRAASSSAGEYILPNTRFHAHRFSEKREASSPPKGGHFLHSAAHETILLHGADLNPLRPCAKRCRAIPTSAGMHILPNGLCILTGCTRVHAHSVYV